MSRYARIGTSVVIVSFFVAVVVIQILAVPVASDLAVGRPAEATFLVPYSIAGILGLVCIEFALLALLRLVNLAANGHGLSDASVKWVKILRHSITAATAVLLLVTVHQLLFAAPSIGRLGLCLLAILFAGTVGIMVTRVLQYVLAEAVNNHHELAAVV